MAFTTIPSSSIVIGQPITADLFALIKGNEDDLNTRVGSLEVTSAKVEVFDCYMLNGSSFSTASGLMYYEAIQAFTVSEAFIRIFTVGSMTGTIEIDVLKATTLTGTYTSIFTTKPSITLSGAVDGQASTNKVFNSGQIAVAKGNFLRLDITQNTSTGILPRLLISVYGA